MDMAEEAHWRLDDHQKRIDDVSSKLDTLVKGAQDLAGTPMAMLQTEIEKMIDAKLKEFENRDKAEDRKMIRDMFGELFKQYEDQEIEVTKNGTVETPDGVHKMTVTETRRRKAKD
jgi:hypothetical protein